MGGGFDPHPHPTEAANRTPCKFLFMLGDLAIQRLALGSGHDQTRQAGDTAAMLECGRTVPRRWAWSYH